MTAVDDFLDAIEGTEIPYVEAVEDAQNPYCDSCSEPVFPNSPVQLYGVNRLLTGDEVPGGFRCLRLHCEECRLPELYFACVGYDEYLVDAVVDTDWVIHDPEIADVSPDGDGIDYNPRKIIEALFEVSYESILAASGYEAQGPLDAVDVLVATGIDPREVIHDDGSITVTDAHRDQFAEEAERIFEDHAAGGGPPQPSVSQKLRAYFGEGGDAEE